MAKAGALASVGLAGCIGDDSSDDLPIAEGGHIPEEKRDLFGPDDTFAPPHEDWMINVVDESSTLGGHFDYEADRHEFNTEASHYDDDFQTVTVSGITEEDWKQILRDDLTENRRPRGPNTGSSASNLERFIQGRNTSVDEIFEYVDEAFENGEEFYNDPDNVPLRTSSDLRPGEVFDVPEWAERVFMGLFEGIDAEAGIRGDKDNLMGSGAYTEATYTLFRKYAEEELGKEIFEDFHVWRFGTEASRNDDWLLNHSMIGFAYSDDGEHGFRIVEPVPPSEGRYTDSITENIDRPENKPYFNDEKEQASTLNPNRALELVQQDAVSINEERIVHNKLLEDIRAISDSATTYEDSTSSDAPDYAVWFSEEFRDSVEDTFTDDFTEDDMMNAVYTSRGLIEIQNSIGYERPLKVEGTMENPVVSYTPEEKVERLVEEGL